MSRDEQCKQSIIKRYKGSPYNMSYTRFLKNIVHENFNLNSYIHHEGRSGQKYELVYTDTLVSIYRYIG